MKRVVKLPILGQKIVISDFKSKKEEKVKWLEVKKQ